MAKAAIAVGRVLRTSNQSFVVGCRVMQPDIPVFGSFVRAEIQSSGSTVYGLIYDVSVEDDPFVRHIVLAEPTPEVEKDQRENRQVPIEVAVLAVGYTVAGRIVHGIPPQPPVTMDYLYPCTPDEVAAFTRAFDYFRIVLNAPGIPADQLLAASIRAAAEARPAQERTEFLVQAGQELARLLGGDLLRLDGLLRAIRV